MPSNPEVTQVVEAIDHSSADDHDKTFPLKRVTPRLGPVAADGSSLMGATGGISFRHHNDHTQVEVEAGNFLESGPVGVDIDPNSNTQVDDNGTVEDNARQDLPDIQLGEYFNGGYDDEDGQGNEPLDELVLSNLADDSDDTSVSVTFSTADDVSVDATAGTPQADDDATVDKVFAYVYKMNPYTVVATADLGPGAESGAGFEGEFDPDDFTTSMIPAGDPSDPDVGTVDGPRALVASSDDYNSGDNITVDGSPGDTFLVVLVPVLKSAGSETTNDGFEIASGTPRDYGRPEQIVCTLTAPVSA